MTQHLSEERVEEILYSPEMREAIAGPLGNAIGDSHAAQTYTSGIVSWVLAAFLRQLASTEPEEGDLRLLGVDADDIAVLWREQRNILQGALKEIAEKATAPWQRGAMWTRQQWAADIAETAFEDCFALYDEPTETSSEQGEGREELAKAVEDGIRAVEEEECQPSEGETEESAPGQPWPALICTTCGGIIERFRLAITQRQMYGPTDARMAAAPDGPFVRFGDHDRIVTSLQDRCQEIETDLEIQREEYEQRLNEGCKGETEADCGEKPVESGEEIAGWERALAVVTEMLTREREEAKHAVREFMGTLRASPDPESDEVRTTSQAVSKMHEGVFPAQYSEPVKSGEGRTSTEGLSLSPCRVRCYRADDGEPHDEAFRCAGCERPVCGYCARRADDEWLCPDCPPDPAEPVKTQGADGGCTKGQAALDFSDLDAVQRAAEEIPVFADAFTKHWATLLLELRQDGWELQRHQPVSKGQDDLSGVAAFTWPEIADWLSGYDLPAPLTRDLEAALSEASALPEPESEEGLSTHCERERHVLCTGAAGINRRCCCSCHVPSDSYGEEER